MCVLTVRPAGSVPPLAGALSAESALGAPDQLLLRAAAVPAGADRPALQAGAAAAAQPAAAGAGAGRHAALQKRHPQHR